MKLIPILLTFGILAVSGWAEGLNLKPYSEELVKKAEAGDAVAQYDLGSCYFHGEGVTKDKKEAAKWYEKSAEQGYSTAQVDFGQCYWWGHGVVKDQKEAVKWYTKSAEQGNTYAYIRLADCYFWGTGVAQNEKEAVKWYTKGGFEEYYEDAKKHASKGQNTIHQNW